MTKSMISAPAIEAEVWRTGMQLRNRLFTWRDHPSFDTKTALRNCAMRVIGAQDLCTGLGIALPREQLVKTMDLFALLAGGGQNAEYRKACFETALAAFPPDPGTYPPPGQVT